MGHDLGRGRPHHRRRLHRRDGVSAEAVAVPGRAKAQQTWGFEAFRSWPRNVRHRISSQARDRNKGCLLCQENKIAGLEGLAQGRNVELDPTATFSRTDELAVARRQRARRAAIPTPSSAHGPLERHVQHDAERHDQPGLLAGRGRRRATRREPALRALLPREAPVLPRGHRLLRHADPVRLHADGRRPVLRREGDREAGRERDRGLRHARLDQQPGLPGEPGFLRGVSRRRRLHGRRALPP